MHTSQKKAADQEAELSRLLFDAAARCSAGLKYCPICAEVGQQLSLCLAGRVSIKGARTAREGEDQGVAEGVPGTAGKTTQSQCPCPRQGPGPCRAGAERQGEAGGLIRCSHLPVILMPCHIVSTALQTNFTKGHPDILISIHARYA